MMTVESRKTSSMNFLRFLSILSIMTVFFDFAASYPSGEVASAAELRQVVDDSFADGDELQLVRHERAPPKEMTKPDIAPLRFGRKRH
uniref:Uncharacterized protein n=1 Tax=Romanomermis culicivorax TaxID=13658 RepID=A0A915JHQ7_ROMCU